MITLVARLAQDLNMSANKHFSLFDNHLDLAHQIWKDLLIPGKLAVDATCGNGRDTLVLAETGADVVACDLQPEAIANTQQRLSAHPQVTFVQRCHTELQPIIGKRPITVLVYNLGYLPGGDKSLTTRVTTTLKSVTSLLPHIEPGGVISITCYPGHAEGAREESAILAWAKTVSPQQWSCCHHRWLNRHQSPSLLIGKRSHIGRFP